LLPSLVAGTYESPVRDSDGCSLREVNRIEKVDEQKLLHANYDFEHIGDGPGPGGWPRLPLSARLDRPVRRRSQPPVAKGHQAVSTLHGLGDPVAQTLAPGLGEGNDHPVRSSPPQSRS
jgi:hypothetical protein